MERVSLGKNGPKVSRIGIGVWQASEDWHAKDDEVVQSVVKAYQLGINLIDTAEAYGTGHSEEVTSRAIKEIGRDNLVIATKVNSAHLGFEELQKACQASLRRLQIKEIDVYQVHWPDPWEQIPLKYTMRALEKLYAEGYIRAIGVSNFAVRDLEEARSYLSKTDIVSNQIRYNILQRGVEEEVIPYCKRGGIGILAWSPLAQGALTGKYNAGNAPKGDVRGQNALFAPSNLGQITNVLGVLSKIAKKHQKTVAQVALSWLMSNPIVVPIPGAKNPQQSEENAGAADVKLDLKEIAEIEAAASEVKIDYFASAVA